MCLLCDDEKAYQAYMDYLDAMERQGKAADPDKAMDAVLDKLAGRRQGQARRAGKRQDAVAVLLQPGQQIAPHAFFSLRTRRRSALICDCQPAPERAIGFQHIGVEPQRHRTFRLRAERRPAAPDHLVAVAQLAAAEEFVEQFRGVVGIIGQGLAE